MQHHGEHMHGNGVRTHSLNFLKLVHNMYKFLQKLCNVQSHGQRTCNGNGATTHSLNSITSAKPPFVLNCSISTEVVVLVVELQLLYPAKLFQLQKPMFYPFPQNTINLSSEEREGGLTSLDVDPLARLAGHALPLHRAAAPKIL